MMAGIVQQGFMGWISDWSGTAPVKVSLNLMAGTEFSAGRVVINPIKRMKYMEKIISS
jgi:hypothetical protein